MAIEMGNNANTFDLTYAVYYNAFNLRIDSPAMPWSLFTKSICSLLRYDF